VISPNGVEPSCELIVGHLKPAVIPQQPWHSDFVGGDSGARPSGFPLDKVNCPSYRCTRGERFSLTRVYTSSPSKVTSPPAGAVGDHFVSCFDSRCSQFIILPPDLAMTLPVALMPSPSLLICLGSLHGRVTRFVTS
jgi:hypothetical protein